MQHAVPLSANLAQLSKTEVKKKIRQKALHFLSILQRLDLPFTRSSKCAVPRYDFSVVSNGGELSMFNRSYRNKNETSCIGRSKKKVACSPEIWTTLGMYRTPSMAVKSVNAAQAIL